MLRADNAITVISPLIAIQLLELWRWGVVSAKPVRKIYRKSVNSN